MMDHVSSGRHSAARGSREYALLEGLAHVDLEHSQVHDIAVGPGTITFYLDAALLPSHPGFTTPRAGSEFDYRGARLVLDEVTDMTWAGQRHHIGLSSYGETNLGEVDFFRHGNGTFELGGAFGVITARAFDCRLALLEAVPAQGMRRRA